MPVPDAPPPTPAIPTENDYNMLAALPIMTSNAARLRLIIAARRAEDAELVTRLDTVRIQIVEVDREILALKALQVMRTAEKDT